MQSPPLPTRILLPASLWEPIPGETLDFFRESEESVQELFFYYFFSNQSIEDIYVNLFDDYTDTDWANHTYAEQRHYQKSYIDQIDALVNHYASFEERLKRVINWVRCLPVPIVSANVEYWNSETLLITLEYEEIARWMYD
jgi:hypothetical protein